MNNNTSTILLKKIEVFQKIQQTEEFTSDEKILLRDQATKDQIIGLYSRWEKIVKDKIFDFYRKNQVLLNNEIILSKYMDAAVKNSYTRRLFTNSVDQFTFQIEKDILCASNNVNYSVLSDLAARLDLPNSDFSKYLDETKSDSISSLTEVINLLFDSGVDINSKVLSENVLSYLNLIVEQRNSISHEYKMSQKFSIDQLKLYIRFFDSLEMVFSEYLESQIPLLEQKSDIKKCENKEYESVDIKKIIRSNSGKAKTNLIFHLKACQTVFALNSEIMIERIIESENKKNKVLYGYGVIKKIMDRGSSELDISVQDEEVSIEIETDLVIRGQIEDQLTLYFLICDE